MPRRINTSVARICNAVWGGLERETDRAEISDDSNCNYRVVARSIEERRVEGWGGGRARGNRRNFFPPLSRLNVQFLSYR